MDFTLPFESKTSILLRTVLLIIGAGCIGLTVLSYFKNGGLVREGWLLMILSGLFFVLGLYNSQLSLDEDKLSIKKSFGILGVKNEEISINEIGRIKQIFYRGMNGENLCYWEFYKKDGGKSFKIKMIEHKNIEAAINYLVTAKGVEYIQSRGF